MLVDPLNDQSYFVLKAVDLKDIDQLTYHYASKDQNATIEVHTDSPTGPTISTASTSATGDGRKYADVTAPVQNPAVSMICILSSESPMVKTCFRWTGSLSSAKATPFRRRSRRQGGSTLD